MSAWRRGLPPGKFYPGMVDDFEVAFAPLMKWHRRRSRADAFHHASQRAVRECVQRRIAEEIVPLQREW